MVKTIAHVDDDDDTRLAVKAILEKAGYRVVSLAGGQECLEYLQEEHPDLILLDIMMPDVSGWDVATELRLKNRAKYEGIKLIIVTVVELSPERMATLKEKSVDDYIVKPFKKQDLLKKVAAALSK